MLGVGIDWAEEFHLVALGRPGEGVFDIARVEHNPAAVAALIARIAKLEPDSAEVRAVIQTRHGWPDHFAERVNAALASEQFTARDYLIRAKADTIRLACAQLLLLREQRRAWERRM